MIGKRVFVKIKCWWFGCIQHPQDPTPIEHATCMHCDGEVSYSDMVGYSRHNLAKEWIRYWVFRRWFPKRCEECHETGEKCHCLPF